MSTPGAIARMHALKINPADLINRHASGDWGNICDEDKATNDRSAESKGMILSCYGEGDDRLWLITDPGHETSTLLLPEEY